MKTFYRKILVAGLLSALIGLISFSCSEKSIPQYNITFTDKNIDIPIPPDVYTDRVSFDVYEGEIVYNNDYDLHFYNYRTKITRIDIFLRPFDYRIRDYFRIFASYPSGLLLDDRQNLILYNIPEKKLDFIKQEIKVDENSTQKFRNSGSSSGWSDRFLNKFVVSTNIGHYIPGRDSMIFYISVLDIIQQKNKTVAIDFPQDILNTTYKFSKVMRTHIIEEDLSGNGVNIGFMFSCKTFNIKHDGSITKHELKSRSCDCGIDELNVEAARSEQKLPPDALPVYGNLYKDKYRRYYYQIVSCMKYTEAENRSTFLRILNKNYETLAEAELNTAVFRGRFICLPEGLYIQTQFSDPSAEERSITFKKIELVKN